jgi:uncharacterized cofD-like protein
MPENKRNRNSETINLKRPKIVTIGGGTGHFALLSGLKKCKVDLTAVVAMSDDGGSTGVLRDELGVLPPGDLRQCLVALSEADELVRDLFTHRFAKGSLKGHSFGNLFISALEQVSGSIERAVEGAGDVLKIRGEVLPVTLDKTKVLMTLKDGTVLKGEHAVSESKKLYKLGIKSMRLLPNAQLNPKVELAIRQADLIVFGPGNLYSSLIPNLLVPGLADALRSAHAHTVFVMNLMNKKGHSNNFDCARYIEELEKFAHGSFVDIVLYNTGGVPANLIERYKKQADPVLCHTTKEKNGICFFGADLISTSVPKTLQGDPLKRTLIRHDPDKLARALYSLLQDTM